MAVDQSICSFNGCGRPINAKGLCKSHRTQQRKGQALTPVGSRYYNVGQTCTGPECARPATHSGMCRAHYDQSRFGKGLSPLESRRKARPGDICMFEGCDRPRRTWELCTGHYGQLVLRKPLTPLRTSEEESLRQFWSKVDQRQPHECWIWQGTILNSGYGFASLDGWQSTAHRVMWTHVHGPISDDAVVDHLCNTRSCVNPDHLRVVKQYLNSADRAHFPKNTSGYRNVSFDSTRKKWAASFRHRGKYIFVGRFDAAEEASRAVLARKLEVFGYRFRDSLDGAK